MSALLAIATAKADISPGSCPLCPRKRTCAVQLGMSAFGDVEAKALGLNVPNTLIGRADQLIE